MSPLDYLMGFVERRSYRHAPLIRGKIVVVVGAPRSGTSLVARTLLNHLPFNYFSNLTQLFPRSPITANRWFARLLPRRKVGYQTYYGKSSQLSGFSDALHIWDRWLGSDRSTVPAALTDSADSSINEFFGAWQQQEGPFTLAKVNRLNTCAHLLAQASEAFVFICLTRDPVNLAQSLLVARRDITGDMSVPYGVNHRSSGEASTDDVVSDVCDQVRFHDRRQKEQQDLIGTDRYWTVSYEDFCSDPKALVERVCREVLGEAVAIPEIDAFSVSDRVKVDPEEYAQIKREFG